MIPVLIPVLIEAALRALLVALAVGAGLRLLRVRNVLAQKVAWGLVLAASLAMPLVMRWQLLPASAQVRLTRPAWLRGTVAPAVPRAASGAQSAQPFYLKETPPANATVSYDAESSNTSGGNRYPAPVISIGEHRAPSNPQAAQAEAPVNLRSVVLAAFARLGRLRPGMIAALGYLAVCCLLLLRMLYGIGAAAELWLAAEPVDPGMIANIAAGLPLRSSPAVFSPVTIGSGVILPADFAEWDAEKLRIVLAHERSHIRQGDFYLQMVAGVYTALFWFSPLGWWLKRQLSDLGEAISDRAGLQEAASRAAYAQVLLEFAALQRPTMPRPTFTGVAMARTTNLSHRIERLLNDTIFHQSFAASRRALVVGLVFPLALIAATSLVRVEAAGQAPPTPPAPAPAPVSPQPAPPPEAPLAGQSNPDQDPIVAPAPAPAAMPAPPAAPDIAPPVPPIPSPYGEIRDRANEQETTTSTQSDTVTNTNTNTNTKDKDGHHHSTSAGQGYSDSYSSNCDSWAVVTGPKEHISFSGEWNSGTQEAIEKARKLANGKFIWFTHNGNSYMIDDPALIAQVEVMYEPMKALDRAQEELGRQQAKLGQEQEQLAKEQSLAGVPTPDMSREIAQVDAAMAKLKAEKNAKLSQEELADIEAKLGELQGRLGEIDGRIGEQQGLVGEKQGHLGELQGKLGEEQGRLGEKQGKLAQEADRKVKSIIDQSLGNGKARPVE